MVAEESEVESLRRVSAVAANLATVERMLEVSADRRPDLHEFGEWSWLRVFDADDLREFVRDVREGIIVAAREGSTVLLDEHLHAWRVTASEAADPLFREILRTGAIEDNFVEVRCPPAPPAGGKPPTS